MDFLHEYLTKQKLHFGFVKLDEMPYGFKLNVCGRNNTKEPDIDKGLITGLVIAIGIELKHDIYEHKHFIGLYSGYNGIYLIRDEIINLLEIEGYKALDGGKCDIKAAAVLSGIGEYSKCTLIINEREGTLLRFALIQTDYKPNKYDEPKITNLCDKICGIDAPCQKACPHNCFKDSEFNRVLCYKRYLPTKSKILLGKYEICSECQKACSVNKILGKV